MKIYVFLHRLMFDEQSRIYLYRLFTQLLSYRKADQLEMLKKIQNEGSQIITSFQITHTETHSHTNCAGEMGRRVAFCF